MGKGFSKSCNVPILSPFVVQSVEKCNNNYATVKPTLVLGDNYKYIINILLYDNNVKFPYYILGLLKYRHSAVA